MGGNTGEIEIGSQTELYKYINHQAGTTKASTSNILVHMYNIFRLLIGVPDHSSESYREKQRLIGLIMFISQKGVCKSQIDLEDLYTWPQRLIYTKKG